MDVVLYLRYSSNKQTEQSIEGQERVCTAYCKQQGYNIIGRYIDRATSASKNTEKRTEFLRMLKDSDKRLWEGVVVYKLDRFARNRYDSATYKAKLKRNNVRVISATEALSDNPESIILESVLEGMAEFYSKELAQKVNRGMYESAMKCNFVGGLPPLGYKVENKKLVIDPATEHIVREAFELYANGSTVTEITTLFNKKGYRSIKGSEFNKNSFKVMFSNKRYIGIYTYKDIEIENGVPAIIDIDTFQKVQERLKLNDMAPSRGKAKVNYLLAQKLFCGHCGGLMIGECGRSKNGDTYYYYTCNHRRRDKSCNKKPVKKDWIEYAVVQDALSTLTPELIDELADMAVKASEDEVQNNTIIPAIQSEIDDVSKAVRNLLKLVESGAESDTLADRLNELESRKKGLEKQLKEAMADIIVLEKEHIVWWLEKFTTGDIDDEDFRRHIIDLLVNSVTVYDDPDGFRIKVIYNLEGKESRTIKSSDLSGCGSPLEYKPNLVVCTLYKVFMTETKHLVH